MSRAKKLAKNTFWGFAGRIIDTLSYVLMMGIVTRYLGVSSFGLYSFLMSIIAVILPVLLMGGRILSRDIAQDRSNAEKLIGNAITLVTIVSGLLLLFFFAFHLFFPAKIDLVLGLILVLVIYGMGIVRSMAAVFLALESLSYDAMLSILEAMSLLILTGVAVYLDMGLVFLFIAIFVSQALRFSATFVILSSRFSIKLKFGFKKETALYLIKETSPLVASMFMTQLFINTGVFVLMTFATMYDVGIYQAPFRIISRLQLIPLTISASLLPLLSQLAANPDSREELRTKVYSLVKFLVIVSFFVSITGFILADDIVKLLFGPEFLKSAASLRIQLAGVGFFFMVAFFDTLFVSLKRQTSLIKINAIGIIVGFILNLILVPKLGYIGSSLAFPVLNFFCVVMCIFFLQDIISFNSIAQIVIKPVIAAVAVFVTIYCFPSVNKFILASASVVMYPVLLYVSNTFSTKEIGFFKRAVA